MKPIGILGGTFDPVHFGHLITAQAVLEKRGLEKILFIPAYISPHKTEVESSDARHRLNMLYAATEDNKYFEVYESEINKESVSYTVDTIRELKKQYSNIELIIGYDNILKFDTWKEPHALIKETKLVVLTRIIPEQFHPDVKNIEKSADETVDIIEGHPAAEFMRAAVYESTPIIEISGTQIRNRVKNSQDISFFVPQKVKEYIYKFNLYKEIKS